MGFLWVNGFSFSTVWHSLVTLVVIPLCGFSLSLFCNYVFRKPAVHAAIAELTGVFDRDRSTYTYQRY